MSKRQSTIKSFFHNLEDSRKRSHSTENTDEKTSVYDKEEIQTPSNTENECPNNTLTGNQLPGRDKKLKLEDKNRENNDKTSSPTHLMTEHSIDSDSSEQQTIFCNNFKGALNANIGISWFDALEKEFDKPYFKKLNDFLQQVMAKSTVQLIYNESLNLLGTKSFAQCIHIKYCIVYLSFNRNEKTTQFFLLTMKCGHGHTISMSKKLVLLLLDKTPIMDLCKPTEFASR